MALLSPAPPGTHGPFCVSVSLRWCLYLRTLLINLLDDIPDTWPVLVVSTWEGKPGDASNGEGGGAFGDGHNMGLGLGGMHGTVDMRAVAGADDGKKSVAFFLPCSAGDIPPTVECHTPAERPLRACKFSLVVPPRVS